MFGCSARSPPPAGSFAFFSSSAATDARRASRSRASMAASSRYVSVGGVQMFQKAWAQQRRVGTATARIMEIIIRICTAPCSTILCGVSAAHLSGMAQTALITVSRPS